MWCVLDLDGSLVYWCPRWDLAVRWAMERGGEMDVVFQAWVKEEFDADQS